MPAIEYLIRNDRITKMLSLPCSLFLNHQDKKLIVTIKKPFGGNHLLVNHWKLWELKDNFPVCEEFKINKDEIFTSPHVILENYYLLEYEEDSFEVGGRQYTDAMTGLQQQIDYQRKLDSIYNNNKHKINKQSWLWKSFKTCLPNDLNSYPAENEKMIKDFIEIYYKSHWFMWTKWQKHFIYNKGVASELIFKNFFNPKPTWYGFSFSSF